MMKKNINSIFILLILIGCANTDPIVSVNLTERRGKYRLETDIAVSGKIFRGYYHESRNIYERTTTEYISPEITQKIWAELNKGPIKRKTGQEPEGDFQSIGVTWKGTDSTFGVSYSYNDIPEKSPLLSVLKIIQENGLDKWKVP